MMSGPPLPDFCGGWGLSLSGGFPSRAHFWLRPTIDASTVSICGRAVHRNLYNPDGSVCAGMADPGDWTRCKLCEGLR